MNDKPETDADLLNWVAQHCIDELGVSNDTYYIRELRRIAREMDEQTAINDGLKPELVWCPYNMLGHGTFCYDGHPSCYTRAPGKYRCRAMVKGICRRLADQVTGQ